MYCLRNISLFAVAILLFATAHSQTKFSLATDVNVLRSFKKEQQFWAIGQTVHGHFHFTPKDGAYAWLSYYTNGRFHNFATAVAKSPATTPQTVDYRNDAAIRFKHVSLGWKRYLKGSRQEENGWSLYSLVGFGLMIGTAENSHSVILSPVVYDMPVYSGKANFKRLTFDLGLGYERHLGADVYLYTEVRALVPTTDYPSKFLFVNNNAPFTGTANLGIRILFE